LLPVLSVLIAAGCFAKPCVHEVQVGGFATQDGLGVVSHEDADLYDDAAGHDVSVHVASGLVVLVDVEHG